jgi:hypothetical protein
MQSSRRSETAALHSTDSDHKIGAVEHLDQPVEDALIVMRSRLDVFLMYSLRFANGLKSQLLISHSLSPRRACRTRSLSLSERKTEIGVWIFPITQNVWQFCNLSR